jgi:hypothetical protein
MACAVEKWHKLRQLDSKSLEARVGLATIEIAKENYSGAKQIVNEGLEISRRYKPLLELKAKIEANAI